MLNALAEHGGSEGITVNKLMPYTGMRRSAVERHLAALLASRSAEICGDFVAVTYGGVRAGTRGNLVRDCPTLSRTSSDKVVCVPCPVPYVIGTG